MLLPGDLTQHGERENHEWLAARLEQLPFPAYVVPGNHDVITRDGCDRTISLDEFPEIYRLCGYTDHRPYYHQELLPGVHLIGLNSIAFNDEGQQHFSGYVDQEQLTWLSATLDTLREAWVMVMIHHNVLEHLPGQSVHPMGRRYITENRAALIQQLRRGGVNLLFTGHLHVQDIAQDGDLWEVTTGSLVSYPHPYRMITLTPQPSGQLQLQVDSHRVQAVEHWPDLPAISRQWMCDRSAHFMVQFLTGPPFNLPIDQANEYAPHIPDFWANISAGDSNFDYAHLPKAVNEKFKAFGAIDAQGNYRPIDNQATLLLPGVLNVEPLST